MGFIEAIILGLVQGLTEFLPVSSSAHLRIVGEFLPSGSDPGASFTAITQLGTEAAVVVFFWKDIVHIIGQWAKSLVGKVARNDPAAKMGWLIIIGSLPIVVLGVLFQDQIDTTFRSLWIVAATLIVFGVILGIADYIGKKKLMLTDLNAKRGILFGFAQALALIPGVSRSGGTITAGLLMGFDRVAAARYSFLLAIPAVFGSGLYKLFKQDDVAGPFGAGETLVATIVAFIVGLAVIAFLMNYISKRSFMPFVVYRILLGGALIVMLSTGLINA